MGMLQQELDSRKTVTLAVAAVTAGASATEKAVFASQENTWITDVTFIPEATIAADNTNYQTYQLLAKGTGGTGTTVIAQATTSATPGAGVVGGLTSFVPVQIGGEIPAAVTGTFNSGTEPAFATGLPVPNNFVAIGTAVSFKITPAPTSINSPAGILVVQYSTSPALSNIQNLG